MIADAETWIEENIGVAFGGGAVLALGLGLLAVLYWGD